MSVSILNQTVRGEVLRFKYGTEEIIAERLPRLTSINRILIHVHPDCRIRVFAPEQSSNAQVLKALKQRSRWIYQQLINFREQLAHIRPRKYISGESCFYLGKQYVLKINQSKEQEGIKLLRGKLEIQTAQNHPAIIKALLLGWYEIRAKVVFQSRLDAMLDQALWIKERPSLSIRAMKTQWGSCSPKGRLSLNPYLVKAPRDCIDYVILHELCHIAEHNHSPKFYRLMEQVMPNWEAIKLRLDGMAAVFLNDM